MSESEESTRQSHFDLTRNMGREEIVQQGDVVGRKSQHETDGANETNDDVYADDLDDVIEPHLSWTGDEGGLGKVGENGCRQT